MDNWYDYDYDDSKVPFHNNCLFDNNQNNSDVSHILGTLDIHIIYLIHILMDTYRNNAYML